MKRTRAARRQALWTLPADSHATLRRSGYDAPMTTSAPTSTASNRRRQDPGDLEDRLDRDRRRPHLLRRAVRRGAHAHGHARWSRTTTPTAPPSSRSPRATCVLSDAQYQDLAERLQQQDAASGLSGSQGIAQWTQLDDGSWVSEKNPGYPFLVAPFALVGPGAAGAAVLRRPRLRRAVLRRAALAGRLGRHVRRRVVLLVGRGARVRVARLDAHLHRRRAHRRRRRRPALGVAGRRPAAAAADGRRPARVPRPGGRDARPLHGRDRARRRRGGRAGRVALRPRPAAQAGAALVARLGRARRRRWCSPGTRWSTAP